MRVNPLAVMILIEIIAMFTVIELLPDDYNGEVW